MPVVCGVEVYSTVGTGPVAYDGDIVSPAASSLTLLAPALPQEVVVQHNANLARRNATAGEDYSNDNSAAIPAAIAVAAFVVCTFVLLRILRKARERRRGPPEPDEPDTPRMWEIRLRKAKNPAFNRWRDMMPLAVKDMRGDLPNSRGGVAVMTDAARDTVTRDGDDRTASPGLSFGQRASRPVVDHISRVRVAVLIAMPSHDSPATCVGVATA